MRLSSSAVEVVIPVRNGERFIEACLDSVRSQVLQPSAVIVVDDGSMDRTPAILSEYEKRWNKLRVIRSDPRGVSHARNLGLATCTATFVAFLDSDDVWRPEKLKRQVSLFEHGPVELGFVHCAFVRIDSAGHTIENEKIHAPTKRGDVLQAMLTEFYPIAGSASAVVARRALVERVGGFDERLTCGEDLDLWLRLAQASHVDYVPEVLVALRTHHANSCDRANAINPELVLFQRLAIWSRRLHFVNDPQPVIQAFRKEALTVSVANLLRRRPSFGLYRRLKRSGIPLASRLFETRWDYCLSSSRAVAVGMRMRQLIAQQIILKNPILLRLCQKLGRLQNVR
jgi:glycosyltransferase involved in cell wall biosynthesis